jgi:vacuolar-type H+-ATPase subunit H
MAQVRAETAQAGKLLMQEAETRAERRTAEIRKKAEEQATALRETAAGRLEEAAELIVGRVVKQ